MIFGSNNTARFRNKLWCKLKWGTDDIISEEEEDPQKKKM